MELLEIITNFVKQPNTDFAILLNGAWGSGKTHFLNQTVKSILEVITKAVFGLYRLVVREFTPASVEGSLPMRVDLYNCSKLEGFTYTEKRVSYKQVEEYTIQKKS